MRIKLTQALTGAVTWQTPDGPKRMIWPAPGEECDVPDNIAKDLIANEYAEAVKKSKK